MKKDLVLGKIKLPNNIFYAPLAGCSDYPFRQMSAKYGPGLMYCEMVKMEALCRQNRGTLEFLAYHETMRPIGGQLCGCDPKMAGQAAKMLEELGFDVIDLNCGCPVNKVTKVGCGSAMMKNPELIGEVLANMVAAVAIPVTVKIRAGWDENHIYAPQVTKIAEQAGATAIMVHGRTRQQAYRGLANWEYIKACKEAANDILVIGNGDVFDANAAKKMFEQTGCDGVLVSRGTLGQPWIAEDILRALQGQEPVKRSLEDCCQALMEHFRYIVAYRNERQALIEMRRVGCWYFKKMVGTRAFRRLVSQAKSLEEMEELIQHFPLTGSDIPPSSAYLEKNGVKGMKDEDVEMHAIVHGHVQGVFFRVRTQEIARQLGIVGTVQNLSDGTVGIYAQGTRNELNRLLSMLQSESGPGSVDRVDCEYLQPSKPFSDFRIVYF